MINCNTSFGKLKEVVVGRELEIPVRTIDMTFKYFYKEAIGQGLYNSAISEYKINSDMLQLRISQLDGLADLLQSLGVKVYRPDRVTKIQKIKTPSFESEASSASNVRDLTFIYKNYIIETPPFIRNRYFENMNLYKIFSEKFNEGGALWLKSPQTTLLDDRIDIEDWKNDRDFNHIDDKYELAVDAPQFLTIGRDVIANIATYNHYRGFEWVKSFFPESTFHTICCADNHIDGEIVCLKPGVFLLNPKFKCIIDQLPEKFKKWTFLIPEDVDNIDVTGMTDIDIRLASSRGMEINVLSIDENTVIVNENATSVIRLLEKNGFTVIPFRLDFGEIFAGGIHCSTLDLVREDQYIYYT